MWGRLLLVGVTTVGGASLLILPALTLGVRLDFPAEAVPANAEMISRSVEWAVKAIFVICAIAILVAGGLHARRIIRKPHADSR